MAFQADTLVASHQLIVGEGYPIPVLGIGPATLRGTSFIEGPLYIGDPTAFPVPAAALMVAPQQNDDVKVPALWAAYFQGSVRISGTIVGNVVAATKTKPFVIDHPTKKNKKLVHVALEGPENGVYVRGKLRNSCIIELPEYWTKFIDPDTITVNLTPIVRYQQLYVEKIENNKIYVKNVLQSDRINCHYHVYAERADIEKLKIEVDPEEYGI